MKPRLSFCRFSRKIAAKASDGTPCVGAVGTGGAGHYCKMIHNGIEYVKP